MLFRSALALQPARLAQLKKSTANTKSAKNALNAALVQAFARLVQLNNPDLLHKTEVASSF